MLSGSWGEAAAGQRGKLRVQESLEDAGDELGHRQCDSGLVGLLVNLA